MKKADKWTVPDAGATLYCYYCKKPARIPHHLVRMYMEGAAWRCSECAKRGKGEGDVLPAK